MTPKSYCIDKNEMSIAKVNFFFAKHILGAQFSWKTTTFIKQGASKKEKRVMSKRYLDGVMVMTKSIML